MSYIFGALMILAVIGSAVVLYISGKRAAAREITITDNKALEKANEIVAEKRTTSDTTKRMRDGSF